MGNSTMEDIQLLMKDDLTDSSGERLYLSDLLSTRDLPAFSIITIVDDFHRIPSHYTSFQEKLLSAAAHLDESMFICPQCKQHLRRIHAKVHYLSFSAMALIDVIDQLASNLTAKILCDSNVIDLPAERSNNRYVLGRSSLLTLMSSVEEVPETTWRETKGKQQAKETEMELEVRRRALGEGHHKLSWIRLAPDSLNIHSPDDMADSESFLPVTFLTLIQIRILYVLDGSMVETRVQLVRDEMD
ncbi:hypothetical protein EV421DRAFT_1739273 [Armillaria borealis]|uniref:Uncharacterized protein n=1 Tax=Armillaria borealis TaxID=47425 RepID=A0AA39J6R2_9AGAR|nr:hypothetical protein EV421DRAFT_1739273 [Armillaria borealis]